MKLDIIKEFEGLKFSPYYATADEKIKGIVTIGYGNTFYEDGTKVKITDSPITEQRANDLLKFHAEKFAEKVKKLVTKEINENQLSALTSLAYNIGLGALQNSTLLKLVNINPSDGNIAKEFLKWNKQGKTELKGLTTRRVKESNLYYTKVG